MSRSITVAVAVAVAVAAITAIIPIVMRIAPPHQRQDGAGAPIIKTS